MGLPDILKVHFFLIPMMYVLCLVGFCPGILDIWLTSSFYVTDIPPSLSPEPMFPSLVGNLDLSKHRTTYYDYLTYSIIILSTDSISQLRECTVKRK